jgi:hypothetical protein
MYVYLSPKDIFSVKIDGCEMVAALGITKAPANAVKIQTKERYVRGRIPM